MQFSVRLIQFENALGFDFFIFFNFVFGLFLNFGLFRSHQFNGFLLLRFLSNACILFFSIQFAQDQLIESSLILILLPDLDLRDLPLRKISADVSLGLRLKIFEIRNADCRKRVIFRLSGPLAEVCLIFLLAVPVQDKNYLI